MVAAVAAWVMGPAVARYICAQRGRLLRNAAPLSPELVARFRPYFQDETLDSVRFAVVEDLALPRFPYARAISRIGLSMPDPQFIAGITFDHLVAIREEQCSPCLLFHELVHVVQYRLLGTAMFARCYVHGFLTCRGYDNIPLEVCASTLEQRFASGGRPFSVEAAVSEWIEKAGYRATIRTGPNSPDSIGS